MFKVKNKDIRMTSMTIALTTLLLNLRKICAITSKGVLKTQTSIFAKDFRLRSFTVF